MKKTLPPKNPLANDVKNHVRLPSQPPFSFLFCAKTKKTLPPKNPLANDVKKHVGLIFSPVGGISYRFQTFRQSYLKKVFNFATKCDKVRQSATKCDIAETKCDKVRQSATVRRRILSHFVSLTLVAGRPDQMVTQSLHTHDEPCVLKTVRNSNPLTYLSKVRSSQEGRRTSKNQRRQASALRRPISSCSTS